MYRQWEIELDRDIYIDRQINRQIEDIDRDRQRQIEIDKDGQRQIDRYRWIQMDTDRYTDRQIDTDRQIQIDR